MEGNAGTPSGDLMWKSGSRAESSVQALCAVLAGVKCAVNQVHCSLPARKSAESRREQVKHAVVNYNAK